MGLLKENLFFINSNGQEFDVDKLFESFEDDSERVLANDEVGTILYTVYSANTRPPIPVTLGHPFR